MKLFEYDIHIGDWRVLVQSKDIQNGAVQSRHITDDAVTNDKLANNSVMSRNIADDAVTNDKLADGSVSGSKLKNGAITGDKLIGSSIQEGKLADDAVQTRNIKNRSVTGDKLADGLLRPRHLNNSTILHITEDVQNQIDSLEISGMALSTKFGNDPHIGICQKTLTLAINNIWAKLEQITGEQLLGITLTASPDYTVGEWNSTVTIEAHPSTPGEVFDHVAIYNGDELLVEGDDLRSISTSITTQVTANIRCEATILGIPYVREKVVTHFASFWLGAGNTYQDVMIDSNLVPLDNGMRLSKNVECADSQRIIIIMGETLRNGFLRADINSVEMPFSESTIVVDGHRYKLFVSDNSYQEGTYNINING